MKQQQEGLTHAFIQIGNAKLNLNAVNLITIEWDEYNQFAHVGIAKYFVTATFETNTTSPFIRLTENFATQEEAVDFLVKIEQRFACKRMISLDGNKAK